MTNQVAEAIVLLTEEEINFRNEIIFAIRDAREIVEVEFGVNPFKNKAMAKIAKWESRLNIVATHLAEFREHEGAHSDLGYLCQKCTKSLSQNGMTIRHYPCDFITTKAQRLLGEASND